MDYILLALSWAIFYSFHSILAASKLKRILEVKLGKAYKWYRLFYSFLSAGLFLGIVIQSLFIPNQILIQKSPFMNYVGYMMAALGTIISLKATKQISISSFIGINPDHLQKTGKELITAGWYARMRHPLYSGLILIFLGYFLVAGTVTSGIHLLCLLLYLPFGIYYEEQNLISLFGDDYREYQQKVPSVFPRFKK